MKRNLLKLSERIANTTFVVRMLVEEERLTTQRFLGRFLKRLDKDLMQLEARLTLFELAWKPRLIERKSPGASQGWWGYKIPYRCWACRYMGTRRCDNPFINRFACSNFTFNKLLSRDNWRLTKYMESGKHAKMARLKPPAVKTFTEHLAKCKVCQRAKGTTRSTVLQKVMKHYLKYKSRRIKKVAAFLAFYGISYSPDYIWGWEE